MSQSALDQAAGHALARNALPSTLGNHGGFSGGTACGASRPAAAWPTRVIQQNKDRNTTPHAAGAVRDTRADEGDPAEQGSKPRQCADAAAGRVGPTRVIQQNKDRNLMRARRCPACTAADEGDPAEQGSKPR